MINTSKIMVLLCVTVISSFLVTSYFLRLPQSTLHANQDLWESFKGREPARHRINTASLLPVVMKGAKSVPSSTGLLIRSTFEPATKGAAIDGSIFYFMQDQVQVLRTKKKSTIALEISIDELQESQTWYVQMQYTQNFLKVSGWNDRPLKFGWHIYSFEYEPAQKKPVPLTEKQRVDSVGNRSDHTGQGREIVLHEIRVYGE